jgi:hypothetical protein
MQWSFKGLLVGRNHHRRAHIDDTQLDGYGVNVGEEQVRRPEILCRRGLGLDSADELGVAGRKAANAIDRPSPLARLPVPADGQAARRLANVLNFADATITLRLD